MTNLEVAAPPPDVPGPATAPGHPRGFSPVNPLWAGPGEHAVASRDTLWESQLPPVPVQRRPPPPPRTGQDSWPQVWAALDRAQATYDPQVLDTAEKAALACYRPAAQAVANNAAPGHGLDQPQAEMLAESALAKAIRHCRAWNIRGFELYVHAAVESELRTNARPAPVPPLSAPQ